jgi:hypothetical protein
MNVQQLVQKWAPVLDHPDLGAIKDTHKKAVVAQLLENQEIDCRFGESAGYRNPQSLLTEAVPANAMQGSSSVAASGAIDTYDPVLISLVRRSMPNLIAYDVCGVQPMTGPTGLIFAMRSRYTSQGGTEALFNEADTDFAGSNTSPVYSGLTPVSGATPETDWANNYTTGTGMTTAVAEGLGSTPGTNAVFQEMAFSIEKVAVTAQSRALKAEYTMELAQDLKAVHGLDAEQELANILSTEILAEINREVIRQINRTATIGAQENVASSGTFNLDVDANGRWSVEKFKGLMFQLERESNAIAKATRRGKGNVMICSSDVASALQMAGVLDYTPALSNNLQVDDTGNTSAGVLNGRIRVYIDPYFAASSGVHYATIGYKGTSAFDAGLFYCPYVPLQMVRAVGQDTFQPKIGFKTRYGMIANPFATTGATGALASAAGFVTSAERNIYYRKFAIANLM